MVGQICLDAVISVEMSIRSMIGWIFRVVGTGETQTGQSRFTFSNLLRLCRNNNYLSGCTIDYRTE